MRFRRAQPPEEAEINLIPLIDVLLVLLIFLTATTTFARFGTLGVALPAAGQTQVEAGAPLHLEVSADGRVALEGQMLASEPGSLAAALRAAAQGRESPLLVIYADAQASHQSVVDVMQAARAAGIGRLSFGAQDAQRPARP